MKVGHYIKSNGLQEQAGDIGMAVTTRLSEIKTLLGKYNAEALMNDVQESDETEVESLKERLTKNVFDESIQDMLPRIGGYLKQYQSRIQAESTFKELQQQIEESSEIYFTEIPDVEMASMIVYESPTVNTTELINMVLPVLEDQEIQNELAKVAEYVGEGLLDPASVENLTRSMINKAALAERRVSFEADMFESAFKKFDLREILK